MQEIIAKAHAASGLRFQHGEAAPRSEEEGAGGSSGRPSSLAVREEQSGLSSSMLQEVQEKFSRGMKKRARKFRQRLLVARGRWNEGQEGSASWKTMRDQRALKAIADLVGRKETGEEGKGEGREGKNGAKGNDMRAGQREGADAINRGGGEDLNVTMVVLQIKFSSLDDKPDGQQSQSQGYVSRNLQEIERAADELYRLLEGYDCDYGAEARADPMGSAGGGGGGGGGGGETKKSILAHIRRAGALAGARSLLEADRSELT
eukprot:762658-Hanusia_phi.AAC.2